MSAANLSRPHLRALLFDVLRTDSDLEAFLLDYFPDVKRRVSSGMIRDAKVNLLLEVEDLEQIYAMLTAAYPAQVKRRQANVPPPTMGTGASVSGITPRESGAGALEIVVLTALGLEHQAVTSHLNGIEEQTLATGTLADVGCFATAAGSVRVAVIEAGVGGSAAAAIAQETISHYQPTLVMFVGVAGGVKDVKLGDIVVATKVYGYESGKAASDFLARPHVGQTSFRYLQRARAEARKTGWLQRAGLDPAAADAPLVHIGAVAAGSAVIASTKSPLYEFLRSSYGDTLAVEMESHGFLEAAHHARKDALIIRGISDLIDKKAAADKGGWQPRAAKNAAAFAFEVIAKSF